MKTITKEFTYNDIYDLNLLGKPETLLFFDIETTGLSAKRDMVYLIGCVYLRDGCWHMKQWFADSVEAEEEILLHFFLFASRFTVLIHFNGSTFDLPFLKERASRFHTPLPGRTPKSIDLYREIKPLKNRLGLSDCRQKTLEAFLGTERQDPYDGGKLIHFYWEYLRTGNSTLYHALLLHNEEDIKGLPALLALLSYRDFFFGTFHPESEKLLIGSGGKKALFLTCINPSCRIPVPCNFSAGEYQVSCQEHTLSLRIPVFEGTLKYFFSDYANYYYLPEEDRALHKSVAVFVDRACRKKATAKTCYQKHDGLFVPLPKGTDLEQPLFYSEYRKNPPWMEYQAGLWMDSAFLQKFLLATLPK